MISPRELQQKYAQGTNITQLLRHEKNLRQNSDEIIEIAYDLQAGSYIAGMGNPKMAALAKDYSAEIARRILLLYQPTSILEAGIGEATTFSGVLHNLGANVQGFGFDLSWSRVAYAMRWLHSEISASVTLCTGNLFHIPFADNSIDVVYTSHSIEPNGGNEIPILQELFRVARKYLVLLEPAYELASLEARSRMDFHGYCKNIVPTCEALGFNILEHSLFPIVSNPLNPTAITIIKKEGHDVHSSHTLACPKYKTQLEHFDNVLFSPEALTVYPIIGGVPCLRIENGVFASKYKEMWNGS